jgi:hypothetical protein
MIEQNKITTNPDPANGTIVPNVGVAAARPKPRGKRATLAAAVVSAGLTLFGLGMAAGTAHADEPGQEQPAPGDAAAPAPLPIGPDAAAPAPLPTGPDGPGPSCIPWAPGQPCVPNRYIEEWWAGEHERNMERAREQLGLPPYHRHR